MDLAVGLGGAISNAFENPKEAVAGLWEAIKTNIVNRITGLIDTFKFFGKTIKAAFNLDFDEVKKSRRLPHTSGRTQESLVSSIIQAVSIYIR